MNAIGKVSQCSWVCSSVSQTKTDNPNAPAKDSITVISTMIAPMRALVMAKTMVNTKANVASIMMMMSLANSP